MEKKATTITEKKILANAYNRYEDSCMYSLYDAYGRFSRAKEEAYEDCLRCERDHNGRGLKIIGACTSNFSVGFLFEDNGVECFMYITKDHRRYAPVSELEFVLSMPY